ncbi:ead/Ea22-like family protein [Enterobacter roggenkampii]|uniref:ead/Ea22-like family protein n=1 Tax=Enterobacter roggenkampii TaxID=1812935 RepID=UPI0015FDB29D|nr:ead/Ea22-like family protein [Enterobacter roggenkampii]MBA7914571.1 ead/Ea22-like family protein [Enterobacter roggenkampii]
MINIDKRALREAAEKALNARERLALMQSVFDDDGDDVKPEAQEAISICVSFNDLTNPATVLALLDELEESERLRLKFQEANCELCQKLEAAEKRIADYHELISGLVGVSSSILREVERITNAASAAGKGEAS